MLVKESIKSEINVPIKMRDGTILYADVYRPDDAGRHPAILARTPYDKSDTTGNTLRGYMNPQKFVRNACVVVIQDLRGTGVSEGVQDVRVADADDGYDTVEWIAAQPWCNGNVGMYGLSHLGFTQWAAAKARPPHLKTICPAGTQAGARPYKYGAFRLNQILVWYLHMTAGAFVDVNKLHIRWFDHWLKGIENGIMAEPRVRIFVMGDNVWPDGKAYNLVDGIMRARYRISEYVANFIKPGKIYKFSFNPGATSNVFKAGHRIRFQVSSSGFPMWDRNLNTGRPIGQDAEMKAAVQTIYHDRKRPSHIILPVISRK